MTKDKWHWTKEKGQMENEQHEKVSVKPRRGISGGSDCKDSGSCLKSRFSISGFLRLFCSVFSVSFLDWVKPKGDDMPIQCNSVLFSECKEINFCIRIHSNHLAEHPIWRAIHLPTGFGMSWKLKPGHFSHYLQLNQMKKDFWCVLFEILDFGVGDFRRHFAYSVRGWDNKRLSEAKKVG